MTRNPWLEDLQNNVAKLVAKSPVAEVERNVKALMGQAFNKMDLVTREDFDAQVDLLKKTTERVRFLEEQLKQLEQRVAQLETN
jgi:hypothetical protein